MPIFPSIIAESDLQENDKTRIDASKSFVSKGSPEIVDISITPNVGGTSVSVFDSDSDNWFLDWSYSSIQLEVASINNGLTFRVGSTNYDATLTAGAYTIAQYATHVASVMTTAYGQTFTASTTGQKVTITGPTVFSFRASPVASQLGVDPEEAKSVHGPHLVEYGTRIVTCTVTDSEGTTATSQQAIQVYTSTGDRLFCSDQDLVTHESDILKWVAPGRASFKNVIRRSQGLIIAWIDEKGYVNAYSRKYKKTDIVDLEEVRQWSIFMSLRLIFEGMSNSVEDVFSIKAKKYEILEQGARQRAILRIDFDEDGIVDVNEGTGIASGSLFRR